MPSCKRRAGDKIGRACVFGHVVRILIPHVDDGGSDLDFSGSGTHRCEQRERRSQLSGEMVNPKIGTIQAEPFGLDGEIDRLQQHISR